MSVKGVGEEMLRDLQEVKHIVLGSTRTRSSKFRRRRGGAGGGSRRTARVTTAFAAATSSEEAGWKDGTFVLRNDSTGELEGDDVDGKNDTPIAYPLDAWIEVDMSQSPPKVRNGTCYGLDPVTFWGDES